MKKTTPRRYGRTRFIQTIVPLAVYKKLEARARSEGVSLADVMRRAMIAALEARPLEDRVRALEVAAIAFGIVPKGVQQP